MEYNIKITDTHAHLYLKQFENDRAEMIQRAFDRGVDRIFLPNIDSHSIQAMYDLVNAYPQNCYAMMGIHPCSIKANFEEELAIAQKELANAPVPFYAIGEIGLDYYWDTSYQEEQKQALKTQIQWAKTHHLPIVLHCRNAKKSQQAFDDIYRIVYDLNDENLTGIFHCFDQSLECARKIMDLGGFFMGIGGVVTHSRKGLAVVLKDIPLEYLVLETDAPFLVPAPYRFQKGGHRNETAYIYLVAEKVAQIKEVTINEVIKVTSQNASTVFQTQ